MDNGVAKGYTQTNINAYNYFVFRGKQKGAMYFKIYAYVHICMGLYMLIKINL